MPVYFIDDRFYTKEEIDELLDLKADKVVDAEVDNLAGLNYEGNLTDSGYSVLDLLFSGDVDGGTY